MRIARKYRTYFGKGADRETLRKTNRDLRSAFTALQQGKRLNARQQSAMRDLPSWSELIDAIRDGVEWYNNRPHDELPVKPNGKHYSPAEFRKNAWRKRTRKLNGCPMLSCGICSGRWWNAL